MSQLASSTVVSWLALALITLTGCGGSSTPDSVDAGVDAGPSCDAQRYTIGAETVLDSTTDLTWQRYEATTKLTWSDAIDQCATLALDGGGWRLPSTTELQSIVVLGASPTIDSCAFPNTTPNWFWSSTEDTANALYAGMVYFAVGNALIDAKTYEYRVRCVR